MPALMPVIVPVVPSMVILVLAVVHVPPVTASVAVIVAPWQTIAGPPIAAGVSFTVTVSLAKHPPAE